MRALTGVDAILVAAGASRRMEGRDKLDAAIGGIPVLRRSVETLAAAGVERIVIVAASSRLAAIAAAPWLPAAVVAVVMGGERRQDSVAAGFAALRQLAAGSDEAAAGEGANADGTATEAATAARASAEASTGDRVVLVHDAARPLASPDLVRRVAEAASASGAAIPVWPVAETLKRVDQGIVQATVDRSGIAAAQTPQGVRWSLLERAYADIPPDGNETWTDEAALLEACRIAVTAIEGEVTNLKLTVPADLVRAEALFGAAARSGAADAAGMPVPAAAVRVGFGADSHPFGPGEGLALGGLRFEGAPSLVGHSDGDVALHALADALLGAAGLGDLGRVFPADTRTPKGIDSREMVADILRRVHAAGWVPASADVTIVAARPRLAARLPEMAATIAALLGLPEGAANVKASTGNLGGAEGAGRAISAQAVAVLVAAGPQETR